LKQGVHVRQRFAVLASALVVCLAAALPARADSTPQTLPFSQDWTNIGLITANDNWGGVPGIEGFRGDGLAGGTGVDPQTILASDTPGVLDVNANQANPNTFTTGGVTEFEITNPSLALAGSGTARGPYLKLYLNTTGQSGVTVAYNLRDIDGSTDNSLQPVALQFRVGNTGTFTNVPAGFVADASGGPSQATLVSPVCAALPAAADNQALVEVRVMTSDAVGNDEWIAVDDIVVSTAPCGTGVNLTIGDVTQAEGNAGTTTFNFAVTLSGPAPGNVTFDAATADGTATVANNDYVALPPTPLTIVAGQTTANVTISVVGDLTTEPNETFFVNLANVVGATPTDAQGLGTIANDDVTVIPIHDIQGNGSSSPVVNTVVTTTGIVTGVRSNGFFIQAPAAEVDADPNTSEGIFVFTSSAPPAGAVIGARVQVTGTVSEFVPSQDPLQPPLTELTAPSVLQLSTGNPLPAPTPITSADLPTGGTIEQLERLEGMRVSVAQLTVVAPTLGNLDEPTATATSNGVFVGVIAPTGRPFREAGIRANDPPPAGSGVTIPPVPRFDGNPERLRVDADGLVGAGTIDVAVGATVSGLVGPLDYAFRTYTLLPDPPSVSPAPVVAGGNSPTTVAAATNMEFTVASYNLERFFDTADEPGIGEPVLTPAAFDNRLNKASLAIRNHLRFPDVLGVVEMENLTTLQALAARISADAIAASQPDPLYQAFLVEGNDIGGIDVGFLMKGALVDGTNPRVSVTTVVQERAGELFVNPDTSTELLNDRPTLRANVVVHHPNGASFPVTVMVNHLRSLNGVDSEAPGTNGWPTAGARVRAKRRAQAESLADLVNDRQGTDPLENIVLVGDFNAFEFNDGLVDSMGTIAGTPTPANQVVLASPDLVDPNLLNLLPPPAERYSFSFDGNAQTLDHVLVNSAMLLSTSDQRVEHARLGADFPEVARNNATVATRISDHDPIVAFFTVATFPVSLQEFKVE
jgi:predicted extracellular nuclease